MTNNTHNTKITFILISFISLILLSGLAEAKQVSVGAKIYKNHQPHKVGWNKDYLNVTINPVTTYGITDYTIYANIESTQHKDELGIVKLTFDEEPNSITYYQWTTLTHTIYVNETYIDIEYEGWEEFGPAINIKPGNTSIKVSWKTNMQPRLNTGIITKKYNLVVETNDLLIIVDPWYDANFQYCANINFTSNFLGNNYNTTNEPVFFWFNDSDTQTDGDDIRLINAPCGETGTEIPYQVVGNNTTVNSLKLLTLLNRTTNMSLQYSIYYGNAAATKPSYGTGDLTGTVNIQINTCFQTEYNANSGTSKKLLFLESASPGSFINSFTGAMEGASNIVVQTTGSIYTPVFDPPTTDADCENQQGPLAWQRSCNVTRQGINFQKDTYLYRNQNTSYCMIDHFITLLNATGTKNWGFIANYTKLYDFYDEGVEGIDTAMPGTDGYLTGPGATPAQYSFGLRDSGSSIYAYQINMWGDEGDEVSVYHDNSNSKDHIKIGFNSTNGTTLVNNMQYRLMYKNDTSIEMDQNYTLFNNPINVSYGLQENISGYHILNITEDATTVSVGDTINWNSNWTGNGSISLDKIKIVTSIDSSFTNCDYNTQAECLAFTLPTNNTTTWVNFTHVVTFDELLLGTIDWYAQICDRFNNCTSYISSLGSYTVESGPYDVTMKSVPVKPFYNMKSSLYVFYNLGGQPLNNSTCRIYRDEIYLGNATEITPIRGYIDATSFEVDDTNNDDYLNVFPSQIADLNTTNGIPECWSTDDACTAEYLIHPNTMYLATPLNASIYTEFNLTLQGQNYTSGRLRPYIPHTRQGFTYWATKDPLAEWIDNETQTGWTDGEHLYTDVYSGGKLTPSCSAILGVDDSADFTNTSLRENYECGFEYFMGIPKYADSVEYHIPHYSIRENIADYNFSFQVYIYNYTSGSLIQLSNITYERVFSLGTSQWNETNLTLNSTYLNSDFYVSLDTTTEYQFIRLLTRGQIVSDNDGNMQYPRLHRMGWMGDTTKHYYTYTGSLVNATLQAGASTQSITDMTTGLDNSVTYDISDLINEYLSENRGRRITQIPIGIIPGGIGSIKIHNNTTGSYGFNYYFEDFNFIRDDVFRTDEYDYTALCLSDLYNDTETTQTRTYVLPEAPPEVWEIDEDYFITSASELKQWGFLQKIGIFNTCQVDYKNARFRVELDTYNLNKFDTCNDIIIEDSLDYIVEIGITVYDYLNAEGLGPLIRQSRADKVQSSYTYGNPWTIATVYTRLDYDIVESLSAGNDPNGNCWVDIPISMAKEETSNMLFAFFGNPDPFLYGFINDFDDFGEYYCIPERIHFETIKLVSTENTIGLTLDNTSTTKYSQDDISVYQNVTILISPLETTDNITGLHFYFSRPTKIVPATCTYDVGYTSDCFSEENASVPDRAFWTEYTWYWDLDNDPHTYAYTDPLNMTFYWENLGDPTQGKLTERTISFFLDIYNESIGFYTNAGLTEKTATFTETLRVENQFLVSYENGSTALTSTLTFYASLTAPATDCILNLDYINADNKTATYTSTRTIGDFDTGSTSIKVGLTSEMFATTLANMEGMYGIYLEQNRTNFTISSRAYLACTMGGNTIHSNQLRYNLPVYYTPVHIIDVVAQFLYIDGLVSYRQLSNPVLFLTDFVGWCINNPLEGILLLGMFYVIFRIGLVILSAIVRG